MPSPPTSNVLGPTAVVLERHSQLLNGSAIGYYGHREDGPVDEGATRPHRDLAGVEAGDFSREVGEPLCDPRCTQDLRQCLGFVTGQPENLLGLVGVLLRVDHHLEIPGASGDHPDAVRHLIARPLRTALT